jgi:hypothetical protein
VQVADDRLKQTVCLGSDGLYGAYPSLEGIRPKLSQQSGNCSALPLFASPLIDRQLVVLFESLAQQLRRRIHGNETLLGDGRPNFLARPVIKDNRFLNRAFCESYFCEYMTVVALHASLNGGPIPVFWIGKRAADITFSASFQRSFVSLAA